MALSNKKDLVERIRKDKGLSKLEDLILRGVTSDYALTTALGISMPTVYHWKKEIAARWKRESEGLEPSDFRAKKIKQFQYITNLSLEAFSKSQEDIVENVLKREPCDGCHGRGIYIEGINIPNKVKEAVYKRDEHKCAQCDAGHNLVLDHLLLRAKGGTNQESNLRVLCLDCKRIKSAKLSDEYRCPECDGAGVEETKPNHFEICDVCAGTGAKPDLPLCMMCNGSGLILTRTTKTTKSAGNPAFLNVARASLVECARIEGIYTSLNGRDFSDLSEEVGGEIHKKTLAIYAEVKLPSEMLIKAMSAIDDIEAHVKRSGKGSEHLVLESVKGKKCGLDGKDD